jgi:hypothetical protein
LIGEQSGWSQKKKSNKPPTAVVVEPVAKRTRAEVGSRVAENKQAVVAPAKAVVSPAAAKQVDKENKEVSMPDKRGRIELDQESAKQAGTQPRRNDVLEQRGGEQADQRLGETEKGAHNQQMKGRNPQGNKEDRSPTDRQEGDTF